MAARSDERIDTILLWEEGPSLFPGAGLEKRRGDGPYPSAYFDSSSHAYTLFTLNFALLITISLHLLFLTIK